VSLTACAVPCSAQFGGAALQGLHDDLCIVPQCHEEAHQALDRIPPELVADGPVDLDYEPCLDRVNPVELTAGAAASSSASVADAFPRIA
jgi:hypothetical protein